MYSLDKVEKKLAVKVSVWRKIENRAKAAGLKPSTIANAILDEAVAKDPWTRADENYVHETIEANRAVREAAKARKGIR